MRTLFCLLLNIFAGMQKLLDLYSQYISVWDQGLDGIFISYKILLCVSGLLTIYTVLSDQHLHIVLVRLKKKYEITVATIP